MTRARAALAGTAALGAAVLVLVGAALPQAARALAPPDWQPAAPSVGGVFHVHTVRSDGTGTVDAIAAAAARVGLKFVIFTDHGDGTRPPDPPSYRSGVLCLDGVEISTTAGHYAAVGIGRAPYPLGGDPRDVVEDVRRLGGIGVVTHPDSAKPALAWRGGDLPFDGLEWLNADSEWRDESTARLSLALLTYPFRPSETVASLFRRPATLARWDALRRARPLVGLAGADAHARIGWKDQGDPYEDRTFLRVPSYESVFRAFSNRVVLERELSGRPREDGDALLAAIRAGHVHTIVDAWARPGSFEFDGRGGAAGRVVEGDTTPVGDGLILRARVNGPAGSRLVLFRDGREVQRVTAAELTYATNRPGSYRAEVWLPGVADAPMPWIVSNAIMAMAAPPEPSGRASETPGPVLATIDPEGGWTVERDASSSGDAARDDRGTALHFTLGPAGKGSQFVALAHPLTLAPESRAIAFSGVAESPMRVSVQVRLPKGRDGERWACSVYLDATPRDLVVPLADMRPAGATSTASPVPARIDSLLFVVDRVHAAPGATGRFSLSEVRVLGAR